MFNQKTNFSASSQNMDEKKDQVIIQVDNNEFYEDDFYYEEIASEDELEDLMNQKPNFQ
jgi:hypothetical protein